MRRTVYVLTDRRGWPLHDICEAGVAALPDPIVAVRAGCCWLDQDVALGRLRALLNLHPGWVFGLATVELVLGAGGWMAASIGGAQ